MADLQSLRIAIEGCGHGKLDPIYASVQKACELKGWDGVDLLIICGDFQAVRDRADLNVTAMPAKYRRMGDFHQYYHGSKVAPYLTVFIGGNHEASNYLFELHYGGWAAPNIYYLGTANVVRLGPLKIASTSGTYKGYDYKRPHFERLPYNDSNMRSIYHQREVDIRKLLSYRSQVDIGLSHDWPAGIEWAGNHHLLFQKKPHFRSEAEAGNFGSKPSAMVLDRLRPPYWFSAHHHFRYTAYRVHDSESRKQMSARLKDGGENNVKLTDQISNGDANGLALAPKDSSDDPMSRPGHTNAISAWNSFKDVAREQDAIANAKEEEARQAKLEEQERTGQGAIATYTVEEDFKQVNVTHNNGSLLRESKATEQPHFQQIPQMDGSCCSLPKRRRLSSPSDEMQPSGRPRLVTQVDGPAPDTVVTNPDAINVDLSDSESDNDKKPLIPQHEATRHDEANSLVSSNDRAQEQYDVGPGLDEPLDQARQADSSVPLLSSTRSDQSQEIPAMTSIAVQSNPVSLLNLTKDESSGRRDDSISTHGKADDLKVHNVHGDANDLPGEKYESRGKRNPEESSSEVKANFGMGQQEDSDISEEVRAQLAEMSSTFAPEEKVFKSPDLPFPSDITNEATRFLALSKVEKDRPNDFLQLLEVPAYDREEDTNASPRTKPPSLQYDPEWLAITRVFAYELTIGGSPKDRTPEDRGQTFYRDRILEEEAWVKTNIVDKGLLGIPLNFEAQIEARDFDNLSEKESRAMPRELTNPQTSRFCDLVGIPNPFNITEEQRNERMAQGPPRDEWQPRGDGAGSSRGGGGGRGRGRGGNHRGRGGGGGRGRGRGRF